MKIVSFNVNSVRLRLHQLQELIDSHKPDIIGLQETKVTDEDFPIDAITEMGYHVEFHGQKTHYGVAMMSKEKPIAVQKGFGSDTEDAQRRLIVGDFETGTGTVRVVNGYFPQGENRSHEVKFPAKEKFYADLYAYLQSDCQPDQRIAIIGDFNVAPVDEDLGIGEDNVKRWLRTGATCFLPEEREWFDKLVEWGLTDSYRFIYPNSSDFYSWFDYRSKGFEREPKRGLRIDHVLVTAPLRDRIVDSGIDYDIRSMEKPSDHCPVWTSFS
ncbi:MAG: exodeoxyribonuclease III [Pseudomonadota bacterium]